MGLQSSNRWLNSLKFFISFIVNSINGIPLKKVETIFFATMSFYLRKRYLMDICWSIKQDIFWFKLLSGNVSQLEIGNLEKTRSIMAEELVKLTNQNDELEEKVKEIPKLRTQLRVSILHLRMNLWYFNSVTKSHFYSLQKTMYMLMISLKITMLVFE